jgi:para-nitrobenzyl esterase
MVWIHGGGFEFGTSADPSIDGAGLAQRGVVLVSCNYRVGVLGFVAHPGVQYRNHMGNTHHCRPRSRICSLLRYGIYFF